MLRDISERGRDLESILAQYITFVKPAFEEFCLPVNVFNFLLLSHAILLLSVEAVQHSEYLLHSIPSVLSRQRNMQMW